ncbi:hypothetical protein LZ30DRAFT_132607 [Colletotrichum cereale]|nr:hypothetical protein LZ30DRAFT_132607 [Colletotrichum cereale]
MEERRAKGGDSAFPVGSTRGTRSCSARLRTFLRHPCFPEDPPTSHARRPIRPDPHREDGQERKSGDGFGGAREAREPVGTGSWILGKSWNRQPTHPRPPARSPGSGMPKRGAAYLVTMGIASCLSPADCSPAESPVGASCEILPNWTPAASLTRLRRASRNE